MRTAREFTAAHGHSQAQMSDLPRMGYLMEEEWVGGREVGMRPLYTLRGVFAPNDELRRMPSIINALDTCPRLQRHETATYITWAATKKFALPYCLRDKGPAENGYTDRRIFALDLKVWGSEADRGEFIGEFLPRIKVNLGKQFKPWVLDVAVASATTVVNGL
ncbi:hypothetical protein EVAR_30317_1 [Eumeta japonica]|uniref:Uncharacterized protein n=1 Tax=Eumeta variegata TaxID=151549 RepID=A0A4C1W988_EUMVA|nr:hypothetical protein EVAR_30317_1 [Eumeta japonica]